NERLGSLLPGLETRPAELVKLILQQKNSERLTEQSAALTSLTELRGLFCGLMSIKTGSELQEVIAADIALEDLAFTVLSRIINEYEKVEPGLAMQSRLDALVLGLENLALSGIEPSESRASESELRSWGKWAESDGASEMFRLRATLARCRRLAEQFGTRIVKLFGGRADKLGHALKVAEHAVRVFSESEVRSHIVFQVAKLTDILLLAI